MTYLNQYRAEVPELDWVAIPNTPLHQAAYANVVGGQVYLEYDIAHLAAFGGDQHRAWTDHKGEGSSLRYGGTIRFAVVASLAFAVGGKAHDKWWDVMAAKPILFGRSRWRAAMRIAERVIFAAALNLDIAAGERGMLSMDIAAGERGMLSMAPTLTHPPPLA